MSKTTSWPDDGIIHYHRVCVLCSGWIPFVAWRDDGGRFRYTSIQSPYGRALAQTVGIDPDEPDTNAVVLDGKVFQRSDAALTVLATLPGWRWAGRLGVIPRSTRDGLYRFIARNRYRVFGRSQTCDLAPPWLAGRIMVDR